jgi:PI-3-kinase-related kinase SMG-1
MIDEVKLFVNEMRRITLLREELWLGTLNQIHSDVNKRIEQLSSEFNRLKANQSLSEDEKYKITNEKYEIILQPIVSILEHVFEITIKHDAQTPNEEQFHFEFSQKLHEALTNLKDVSSHAIKPQNGWSLFKELHQLFHQRGQRRQSSSLNMEQISPKLAAIKASTIPIPGNVGDGQFCTIHSIGSTVLILPTKTKPKKLYFLGSNGKNVIFCFLIFLCFFLFHLVMFTLKKRLV